MKLLKNKGFGNTILQFGKKTPKQNQQSCIPAFASETRRHLSFTFCTDNNSGFSHLIVVAMNSQEWKNQHLKLGELLMLPPYDSFNQTPTPAAALPLPANPRLEREA